MTTHFETGTRCWIPDDKEGWLGVEVTKITNNDNKYQLELVSEDGERVINLETGSLEETNTELPLLRNQVETVEDLTELSHLNEPSVLNAIRERYTQFNIYTYSGIVLIAINPFQRNDELYSSHRIERYASKRRGEEEPHLFAIAEDAYRCMKTDKKNQSIVVSGESGAGKTVSAKYIMRYFATVDSDHSGNQEMSTTEKQILATNPIMEAFGNAKTTRNDNSSRFGKYLEILFNDDIDIIGARIRTYLLERSRLVFQPKSERNYHIFYQMMEGIQDDQKKEFGLTTIEDFFYLNQGGVPKIVGVDDAAEFKDTCDSLELVGITKEKQHDIFKILAALLHIGNIQIQKTRNDAILSSDEPSLVKACELLGLNPTEFAKWIVKKQIITRSEKIVSSLNHKQAIVARDSVAKYIYSSMFDWLVYYVNSDLCPPELQDKVRTFIGVLDIYGFEHFEKNSFEQFCINYANEKLQQEFTQHVFKLEQEEYVKEEIEWSFIEFSDNQPCINVIESRLGVLSLLDEESRLPSGSDDSWIEKMYQTLSKPPQDKVFKKPRFGQDKFIICHYALDVEYSSEGFIEKNRDTVSDGHLENLKATTNQMLADILSTVDAAAEKLAAEQAASAAAKPGKKVIRKPTLGSIFKSSLIELMSTINSTNVHYIRCIKPNEEKVAWEFDPLMVLSQLRACGVLETIKISCAGFPSRSTYPEFAMYFSVLLHSSFREKFLADGSEKAAIELTREILKETINDDHKYQLGKTKIFFKAGILALLEKMRLNTIRNSAIVIQKNLRAHYGRKQYLKTREALIKCQALMRGFLVRDRLRKQLEERSAIKIQSVSRGYLVKTNYQAARKSLIELQAIMRGIYVRNNLVKKQRDEAATAIQTAFRGFTARSRYNKMMRAILFTQSCYRRQQALIEFKALKAEAKSMNRMKEVQYSLENKVIELTQSLSSKVQENASLVSEIEKLQSLVQESQSAHQTMKSRELEFNNKLDSTVAQHGETIASLNEDINKYKIDYDAAKKMVDELTESQAQLKKELQENVQQLREAQEELSKSKDEKDTLNGSILQLKQELIELQKQLTSARQNGVATTPTRSRNMVSGMGGSPSLGYNSGTNGNYEPRPASIITTTATKDEVNLEAINTELWTLLNNSKSLHKEIVDGLLKGLRLPVASVASELTRKEVLFPARIIIIILSDMWRLGLTSESEAFLGEVLSVIQSTVSSLKEDEVISHGAFWLTNTHELYSFVAYAQTTILANDSISRDMSDSEYDEYLKLVAVVKEDFESLSYNIYNMWMKKMQKDLDKKCISAVVLAQALPGFVAPESTAFLSKVFQSNQQYKMDDILTFFNNVYWSMKAYFIEQNVINEVIIELLKFVDALCFNDLVMRRNFLSWKRGLQLNYNVTRLEEWCKGHEIQEGSTYLAHLLQVSKLLQVRKGTPDDIEIIFDICYALRPAQIQKLIAQYYVAEYETPISPAVTKTLADKVKMQGGDTNFLEPINSEGHFEDPFRHVDLRPFHRVEAYVPAWLNVPVIRRIVELVTKNATVQEQMQQQLLQNQEAPLEIGS
ncbi:hypothetical protein CANARDRAFT_202443 [[Candida] arabinofermentans NRRL YB-2248]|uniref:Myosin motor domain-containing protein n=1 Tax=[Candida] arabinofermentans NRRL YB-2248 TaxID=983967 RepID=A0A1E4SWG8_9ASCO|nr:hypothetical protein CANARDRAFT_202443 [[Candida] arabinofermentans NRRL YB-2248]